MKPFRTVSGATPQAEPTWLPRLAVNWSAPPPEATALSFIATTHPLAVYGLGHRFELVKLVMLNAPCANRLGESAPDPRTTKTIKMEIWRRPN